MFKRPGFRAFSMLSALLIAAQSQAIVSDITLQWNNVPFADKYVVEQRIDNFWTEVERVDASETSDTQVTLSLEEGDYTFRVGGCVLDEQLNEYCGEAVSEYSTPLTIIYLPNLDTPAFSPAGGTFQDSVSVTLSTSTPDTTIYYTTDGSTPTSNSSEYGGAFTLTDTTTVKAIATKTGFADSDVITVTFTKNAPERRVVFIHTDLLGSPAAETDEDGNLQ